ncbi:sigma-70 family RNA polymerase sigma factor [Rhodobacteraceae bacterium]|nr:sigma-70 family RNA polymerase sigma factor [Paracoccaceae bacterium]
MSASAEIEELIARVALRDKQAFAALYDATSRKLFGICLRVLNNRAEAEEALQDVFLRIWAKADRYAVTGHSPMTWLITVARNLSIDRLRARGAATDTIEGMGELRDAHPGPEATAIASSEMRRIGLCIDELEEDRASAVRGAYLDGESYADLAQKHDVPLNTMRTWLRRSLQKLKECLSR